MDIIKSRRLLVDPRAAHGSLISASLLQSQGPLIQTFPLAAFCCDVDDAVVCYNEACRTFWGRALGPRVEIAPMPAHSILASSGSPLPPDLSPSAIALSDPPMLEGLSVEIEQPSGRCQKALLYSRLALNECGSMVGVVCVLIDPDAARELEAAIRAAESAPERFMERLAAEAGRH